MILRASLKQLSAQGKKTEIFERYFWILQQLSIKKRKNIVVMSRLCLLLFSPLPKNLGVEWWVCVSASPACRSAVRLAWRSEGGKTQTVANSVVADWQKEWLNCVELDGCSFSSTKISWGCQSAITHCQAQSKQTASCISGSVSGCVSGCEYNSHHLRDHADRHPKIHIDKDTSRTDTQTHMTANTDSTYPD